LNGALKGELTSESTSPQHVLCDSLSTTHSEAIEGFPIGIDENQALFDVEKGCLSSPTIENDSFSAGEVR
jgi:hypothetical protein